MFVAIAIAVLAAIGLVAYFLLYGGGDSGGAGGGGGGGGGYFIVAIPLDLARRIVGRIRRHR